MMVVTNNRVAGTWHHGFHFKPSKCDRNDPDYIFENNIAHSISGYGGIAENNKWACAEVKDFLAYKCGEAAIMHGGPSMINRGRRLVSIESRYGIAVHASEGLAEVLDSKSVGEIEDNYDCPEGSPCDHCIEKIGMVLPLGADGGHNDRQEKSFKLPLFGGGSLTGYGYVKRHTFLNYDTPMTKCGRLNRAIKPR